MLGEAESSGKEHLNEGEELMRGHGVLAGHGDTERSEPPSAPGRTRLSLEEQQTRGAAARRCCHPGQEEEEVSKLPLPQCPAALEVVQMWIRRWWRSFGPSLPAATK